MITSCDAEGTLGRQSCHFFRDGATEIVVRDRKPTRDLGHAAQLRWNGLRQLRRGNAEDPIHGSELAQLRRNGSGE